MADFAGEGRIQSYDRNSGPRSKAIAVVAGVGPPAGAAIAAAAVCGTGGARRPGARPC